MGAGLSEGRTWGWGNDGDVKWINKLMGKKQD